MFGAETILMNRCRTEKLFNKTVDLINNFKEYFLKYGEKTDENPSPGNKAGGITTIADKSLGCVQKGGSAVVEDVLSYAEPVKKKGLSLLQAPGNDLVASNALAASGTLLHFLNHSLFKLLLFLGAGVIFMNLRELNLNKIRGYGKDKPLLKLIFLMPILGIGGIPLWNGYISKTLIHESMVEYIEVLKEAGQSIAFMKGAEILFLFSGGLTLAYMTKIFVCIFLEDNPYGAPKPVKNAPYISKLMAVILGAIAICLPILGIFPHQTQDALAAMGAHFMNAHTPAHAVHYFAWVNLKGAVISICVGIVVYFLFIRKVLMQKDAKGNLVYVDRWPEWCNLEDKVYRPILLTVLPYVGGFFARIAGNLMDDIIALLRIFIFI